MDKALLAVFDNLCCQNNVIIETQDDIVPVCFIVKDQTIEVISFIFRNSIEKEIMKAKLKQYVLSKKIDGYMLIFDTKATSIHETGQSIVQDCVMRALYTPKESVSNFAFYKNHNITEIIKRSSSYGEDYQDEWNVWGEGIAFNSPINEKYQNFKSQHKDLYD